MKPQCLYCPNCGRNIPEADLNWNNIDESEYATIACPECGIQIDMESKSVIESQGKLLVIFQ